MASNNILNAVGRIADYAICAAISTVAATVVNQFVVPKIIEVSDKHDKANRNPIGFRAD